MVGGSSIIAFVDHCPKLSSQRRHDALLAGCKVPDIDWRIGRALAISEFVSCVMNPSDKREF
jgi:hypothetical protein